MRNIFIILLIPLLKGISGGGVFKQKEIATEAGLENEENLDETSITTVSRNPTKKLNYNEVRKSYVKQNKYEGAVEKNKLSRAMMQKKRDTGNGTYFQEMECLSCFGDGTSPADFNCYKASHIPTLKCADFEQCYTEIHPQFIKRGCILPLYVNRTFVCKCPLCNDKPSDDLTYFEYSSFNDWRYDNKRLDKPVMGLNLPCKYCETKGLQAEYDNACKEGKNTDYTICGQHQMCFTNIDSEISFVSRGCIEVPAYNSIYLYCNKSNCNDRVFDLPEPEKLKLNIKFKAINRIRYTTKNKASYNYIDVWLVLVIIVHKTILF